MIRTLVGRVLAGSGVRSAPVDVDRVAASLGAEVRREPADNELSGFLLRDTKAGSVVIGVNSNHHPNRQRFTIAHECGHLLLHKGEKVHVDRQGSGFHVNLRDAKAAEGVSEVEKEANLFAAELLMPASFLETDLAKSGGMDLFDEDVLNVLAGKYRVSAQALTYRLAYLGYVK